MVRILRALFELLILLLTMLYSPHLSNVPNVTVTYSSVLQLRASVWCYSRWVVTLKSNKIWQLLPAFLVPSPFFPISMQQILTDACVIFSASVSLFALVICLDIKYASFRETESPASLPVACSCNHRPVSQCFLFRIFFILESLT